MRTLWSWPPPSPPSNDETSTSSFSRAEILVSIAGTALLGGIAYAIHRDGEISPPVAAALRDAFDTFIHFVEPPPTPAPPPKPKRKTRGRAKPRPDNAAPPPPSATSDNLDQQAAAILGIPLDASEDTIRAAFRRAASTRLAQGLGFGDLATNAADQRVTLEVTNAKNRLLERARRMRRP